MCALWKYTCSESMPCVECSVQQMIGHFARVCSFAEKKHKTNNSRKRDKERMTAFVRRKTAETALPFINADDDCTLEMQINTSAFDFETFKREMDDLKCINIRLEDDLRDIRSQCIVLQESTQESALQINMLKHEKLCLQSKLNAEQQTFQTIDSTLKENEAELRDTNIDVIQLKTESSGLNEQIVFLVYMRLIRLLILKHFCLP